MVKMQIGRPTQVAASVEKSPLQQDFDDYWKSWSSTQRPTIALPGPDIEDCASVLLVVHKALGKGEIHVSYSGPLINAAIRAWEVPIEQRYISERAIAHINADGKRSFLIDEHDAPIALYRDLIRYETDLSPKCIIDYLRQIKLTKITREENGWLDREWKSERRPPDAYDHFGIVRLSYADHGIPAMRKARERSRVKRLARENQQHSSQDATP